MGKKVLVVDDSVTMRDFLKDFLEKFGFEVTTCEDGVYAAPHIGEADAMITDLEMPRRDGAELTRIAKLQKPEMPVMIMTGNSNGIPDDHLADVVIEKPFKMGPILDWLGKVTK